MQKLGKRINRKPSNIQTSTCRNFKKSTYKQTKGR